MKKMRRFDPPIVLRQVNVHNLKGVDLSLTPKELIVFTGVSGSGKSSLAFDTIYVEGQRRYIESLSHQAQRFLGKLPKPEAESISEMAPTIAIEQKGVSKSPRSTVGTMTGIYDFLRVLFARVAIPYCPISQEPVDVQSPEKITREIQNVDDREKLLFLAPYVQGKKGTLKEEIQELLAKGFTKLRIDGVFVDSSEEIALAKDKTHTLEIVIDRIIGKDKERIAEAVKEALDVGKGFFFLHFPEKKLEKEYSQYAYSKKSGLSYGPLEPHHFSFNHPSGMCPRCHGLGISQEFDLSKVIEEELSIQENCCKIASPYETVRYGNIYNNLARLFKFSVNTPWKKLSKKAQDIFLYGTEKKWTEMRFIHPVKKSRWIEYVRWRGVLFEAKERFTKAKSEGYRKKVAELMVESICPDCNGSRILPYPSAAQLQGKTIAEVTSLTLEEALLFFQNLKLNPIQHKIAEELLKEIRERLFFLMEVGLGYLTLDRSAPTLSGGEAQRVRLSSELGAGLVGAIYVLDEPSIGLHPADHHRLIQTLIDLKNLGNTVIVVEHDKDTILAADTVVDVGPLAGKNGGEILFVGKPEELQKEPRSLTGAYLSGKKKIARPKSTFTFAKEIEIQGAKHHNLQGIDVKIPLKGLIAVTGPSGSGKSSLITDTLYPALSNLLQKSNLAVGVHKKIVNAENIDKVIAVDQSPIGKTPRSNLATYTKLFDEIRTLFASLPSSQVRGFSEGHFSFNVKEGSCPYCSGLGFIKIDMDFMEDVWTECLQCGGDRFDPEVLSVEYKGKNISEVLKCDVETAKEHFAAIPSIRKKLEVLSRVGLDYLSLGQPSTTLSGGEAQRIKLAKELVRPSTGNTLYIFDEPTTGLHFHDIQNLINIFFDLIDKGNTVLVIEHNLEMIALADWVLDLGPKAGKEGGKLVASGPPLAMAKTKSPTGLALKSFFQKKNTAFKAGAKRRSPVDRIQVVGALQNNLKELSLSLEHGKMHVFTGPSGSGKSSLAFETLYAEGQRRYTETLSPYARAQVHPLPKPKVERIEGLLPSIAIEQKTGGLNPRSTVGTITEIYDLLRILFAHLGRAFDPETKEEIRKISKQEIQEKLLKECDQERVQILAPVIFEKKESFSELTQRLLRMGFLRLRLNGTYFELEEKIPFEEYKKNELFLVIDRLKIDRDNSSRLLESLEKAISFSKGFVTIARESGDLHFNLAFASIQTAKAYPAITPQTFSFNHDAGMCLECQGLGAIYGAHLMENPQFLKLTPLEIMDRLFKEKGSSSGFSLFEAYFVMEKIDVDCPMRKLPLEKQQIFLYGGPERKLAKKQQKLQFRWIGLEPLLSSLAKIGPKTVKEALLPTLKKDLCPSCEGARLNPLARNVLIGKTSIADFCAKDLKRARRFLEELNLGTKPYLQEIKERIEKYLDFLLSLGLHYLSLNRAAPTLSGGELQRIRLAKQLGSGLTSCLYVLDEPTIGLHPHNSEQLLFALEGLKKLNNTLVLVEHDPLIIQKADFLYDFGPYAGKRGGKITAQGTVQEIQNNPHSLTGAYLSGKKTVLMPQKRRELTSFFKIANANLHNLKNISLEIPFSALTCVTGVSGSGKSTLLRHLLQPAVERMLLEKKKKGPISFLGATFSHLEKFDQVIAIDQSPIGQTIRADVSTYTEVQPLIRALLANLPKAHAKGLQPRHFSPNHLRGMCRTCWGLGFKTVDLQFLPKVRVPCDACHGNRLNPVALQIEYKGKHLGNILKMSIEEAIPFFSAIPKIVKRLKLIESVGLSYLLLGQEIVSLSGGEAQRLKLTRELARRSTGNTLYLIDEPTVGLHSIDINTLLPIFHALVDQKNTMVIVEHNLDCIKNADYIVDLGPEAGDEGGEILGAAPFEEFLKNKESYTAKYLRAILQKDRSCE